MRALVLSGGGAKGAYQWGALRWLIGTLRIKYDILAGVSVGSLNTSVLSMYPHGEEISAISHLNILWGSLNNDLVYREHRPFARLHSLWRSSAVNNQPLLDLIDQQFDPRKTIAAERTLITGVVSLSSGAYETFTQDSPSIIDAVKASATYPVFFKPIKFNDQLWADGGIKEIVPLKAAINAGATHIDIIIPNPEKSTWWKSRKPTTIEVAMRVLELTYDEILSDDLRAILPTDGSVTHRLLRPSTPITDSSLDFDPVKRNKMGDLGFKEAQRQWPTPSL